VQIVIALIVTPEGLPLAYEILPGNTNDSTTLRSFLAKIEHQYGKGQRIWCMDRGVPTEKVLAEMHRSEPPVQWCSTWSARQKGGSHPLHTTGARTRTASRALAAHASRPTAAQNQRRPDCLGKPPVVQTFEGVP
jgi:transposase